MGRKIICHDVWGKETEIDSSQLSFRPSVYGILIENGKVLLSKQWDGYDFPGGGVKVSESLDEALEREFFEETGIKIRPGKIFYHNTYFFHPNHSEKYKNEYWNAPVFYFLVEMIGGEISMDNFSKEEKDYKKLAEWVDIDKIKYLKFYNSVDNEKVLKEALEIINNQ